MTISIGLVGLGRIGRNVFRLLYDRDDLRLSAVTEIAEPAALEYLLRFDSVLGRFPDEISIRDGNVYVVGRQIPLMSEARNPQTPWGDLGVHTVIEATSKSRGKAELERHLQAGARRVISLAPPDPADPPDRVSVPGITDALLSSRDQTVSNASSTVHCAAPVMRILADAFGIRRAFFTTVHSYTSHQRLADVPDRDKRRGRAAAENIIPQASRSPAMLDRALPDLAGRVTGSAMSVPVVDGSLVDLVCWHEKPVTVTAINEVLRTAAATERWARYLRFEREPIVSKDVARSPYSSVFDSLATMVMRERVSKTLSWFDSGFGYAHRAVELIEHYVRLDGKGAAAA